ncbi:M48 family metallopeptidase [Candidatus Woesearchaeota archaeon]|nr:M48 family metallopeptidase [Candidatus Woesearchaeota archaeon]
MKTERLEVNGVSYRVKIHYEDRNDSVVSLGKKAINIRIPHFLDREEKFRQLMKAKQWAKNKLEENPNKFKPEIQKEYKSGDMLKVGSEEYMLNIELKDKQSSSAKIIGNTIQLAISSNLSLEKQKEHISTLLSRCVASKRLPNLKESIFELNKTYFNREIKKIFFKNLKSRWGSCSEKGNINISTRLLFAPDDVLRYVCIHELAHLIEQNHSDKFWATVEKAMPDYKEKIKWLKENGNVCRF